MANLARLIDTQGITAVVNYFNDSKLTDAQVPEFYSQILLDKIKISSDNYVHLRYAKDGTVPKGHGAIRYRRWGTLTEHTTPLIEGMPPTSDKTTLESITGTWAQFGRYMEFTDKVAFDILDPVVTEYTMEMSDVAVRTLERLARNKMLQTTFERFANDKANVGALTTNDQVSYTDYRVHALLLKRLQVKPINGNFEILISPEHHFDLLNDPLVRDFMELGQTNQPIATDTIPPLFGIKFVQHQLDEFTYGYELANAGEWYDGANYFLRVYHEDTNGDRYFFNIPDTYRYVYDDSLTADAGNNLQATEAQNRLANGSWIPQRVVWDITAWRDAMVGAQTATHKVTAAGVETTSEAFTIAADDVFRQLPVHTSIMLGMDSLIKTGIEGRQGVNMYVKPLGSAGVLDPINQRQSIGFKYDAVGFMIPRDESITLFRGVPTQAITTADLGTYDGIQYN